jgi:phage repressor protein C with HTH and peptisase S24 domain
VIARGPIRPMLAAELLRAGHAIDIPLGGGSMRPLFAPGDILHIVPATAAKVRPGDVVLLDLDGRLLCHRLLYKTATTIVTRGDDTFADDPPQPPSRLIGRVLVPRSPGALYSALRALFRL